MGILSFFMGGGANKVAGAVERVGGMFRPNAEASAQRASNQRTGAMQQLSSEFAGPERKSWFNALVDGLNRLPRPIMAYGVIGLFVYAMMNPIAFNEKMIGLALVPDPLWWLFGAIVSFYFGARELQKGRDGKYIQPATVQEVQTTIQNIEAMRELRSDSPNVAADDTDLEAGAGDNPAVNDWKANG